MYRRVRVYLGSVQSWAVKVSYCLHVIVGVVQEVHALWSFLATENWHLGIVVVTGTLVLGVLQAMENWCLGMAVALHVVVLSVDCTGALVRVRN